jgi:hypothetical protein
MVPGGLASFNQNNQQEFENVFVVVLFLPVANFRFICFNYL